MKLLRASQVLRQLQKHNKAMRRGAASTAAAATEQMTSTLQLQLQGVAGTALARMRSLTAVFTMRGMQSRKIDNMQGTTLNTREQIYSLTELVASLQPVD
jgi:hypothetical protein